MRVEMVLRCGACGAEIEEVCGKNCGADDLHRHGKCPSCPSPMVCVRDAPVAPRTVHIQHGHA